jgi:hypothetical protein
MVHQPTAQKKSAPPHGAGQGRRILEAVHSRHYNKTGDAGRDPILEADLNAPSISAVQMTVYTTYLKCTMCKTAIVSNATVQNAIYMLLQLVLPPRCCRYAWRSTTYYQPAKGFSLEAHVVLARTAAQQQQPTWYPSWPSW